MKRITEDHNAPFLLAYGETNSGKTTSIVRTAPGPILYITVEGDVLKSKAVCTHLGEEVDIEPLIPESHEDLMKFLNGISLDLEAGKPFRFNTLVFDSGTYWMNEKLAIRVEDDRNEGREGKDKGKLSAMTKTDWTEVNTCNSSMSRLTDLLKEIANQGVFTVMTAQVEYDPSWNTELEAAPCFNYKDYNKALKGYFDYIGYTIKRVDKEGKTIYPPKLSFCDSQGYLVKWRGVQPKELTGKFNLKKMFAWYTTRKEATGVKTEQVELREVGAKIDDDDF